MLYKSQLFRIVYFVPSFFILAALFGCSRPDNERSQLSVSIPKIMPANKIYGLSTTEVISHVVVNVGWPESPTPLDQSWDACESCLIDSPPIISFDVPSGQNRRVQVLAIYQNVDTQSMSFYYGESPALTLTGSNTTVSIEVKSLGISSTLVSGQVSGRILESADSGPTGPVLIKFNPNNGRPAMVIERNFILSGWFSFFMLSGVKLEYWLNGKLLFGQASSLDDQMFFPEGSSGNRLRMHMPLAIRQQGDSSIPTYRLSEPQIFVWGYWSPNANLLSDKFVCRDFSDPLSRLAVYSQDLQPHTLLELYELNSSQPFSTVTELLNSSSPLTNADYKGGFNASGGSCNGSQVTDGTLFSNLLPLKSRNVDGEGKERAAGFYGPFRPLANGQFDMTFNSSNTIVNGQVLPGVENVFNGFHAFKFQSGFDNAGRHESTTSCSNLIMKGFLEAGSTSLASGSTFSLDLNISESERSTGTTVVVCPTINGQFMGPGYYIDPWNFMNYNTGNNNHN